MNALMAAVQAPTALTALKATLLFTIALLLLRSARRVPASLRHRVAAATFIVALLLPIGAALKPRVITLPAPAPAPVTVAPSGKPSAEVTAPVERTPGLTARRSAIDLASAAWLAYLGGLTFFLLSLSAGIVRLYRLRASADVSVEGTRLAREIADQDGIRRSIEVVISPRLAVPMTFGWERATILLPADAISWAPKELRDAIRHELEHVVRRDWLTQILSRLTCAIYWPHPQAWMLWSRLRLEAERACDDAVIRGGAAPTGYAEQLVTLARHMTGQTPALAMATRSNLGRRVDSILDGSIGRNRIGRSTSVAIALVAMGALIALAPLRIVAAPQASDPVVAVDAPTEDEAEPLDFALMKVARTGDVDELRALITRGANANAAFSGDGTPLIEAARAGHVDAMRLLLDAGANPNLGVRGDGNPLIAAAQHGRLAAVELLLDRGAAVDLGIPGDGNALIMAAGHGHVDVVKLLLARGASIDAVIPGDENALIHASELGSAEAVRYLISRGADVNARVWADWSPDGSGEWRTALRMAQRNRHEDIVQILRAAGARD